MMPAHQIWSCHVTQEANLVTFLFFPHSTFNIGISHKISSGKALHFNSCQPKNLTGGGKQPPRAFKVNQVISPILILALLQLINIEI